MRLALCEGGRLLSRNEQRLCEYLGEGQERAAIALARHIDQRDDPEQAVIMSLVRGLEARNGQADVEYVSGERRDLLRDHTVARMRYELRG